MNLLSLYYPFPRSQCPLQANTKMSSTELAFLKNIFLELPAGHIWSSLDQRKGNISHVQILFTLSFLRCFKVLDKIRGLDNLSLTQIALLWHSPLTHGSVLINRISSKNQQSLAYCQFFLRYQKIKCDGSNLDSFT